VIVWLCHKISTSKISFFQSSLIMQCILQWIQKNIIFYYTKLCKVAQGGAHLQLRELTNARAILTAFFGEDPHVKKKEKKSVLQRSSQAFCCRCLRAQVCERRDWSCDPAVITDETKTQQVNKNSTIFFTPSVTLVFHHFCFIIVRSHIISQFLYLLSVKVCRFFLLCVYVFITQGGYLTVQTTGVVTEFYIFFPWDLDKKRWLNLFFFKHSFINRPWHAVRAP
jgi:hypothetical protein